MGTHVRIVLYAPDVRVADAAAAAAFARVGALDQALSDYRDSSELMQLSRRSGGALEVSDDLFRVLRASQQIARDSGGAFDVTAGPLSLLWRQARRQNALPDADRIAAARALVGHAKLELDEARRTIRLRQPGMLLDLGGIAKGFAADEAVALLAKSGVRRALVAAGGDIVAGEPPPGADGWRIGIASVGRRGSADRGLSRAAECGRLHVGRHRAVPRRRRHPPFAHLRSAHGRGIERPQQRHHRRAHRDDVGRAGDGGVGDGTRGWIQVDRGDPRSLRVRRRGTRRRRSDRRVATLADALFRRLHSGE